MFRLPTRSLITAPTAWHGRGLLITLSTVLAIEALTSIGARVPTPGAILLLPVAYAAFTGGRQTGLASATLMSLYALYRFAVPDQFLHYTSDSAQTILLLALVAVSMVVMLGHLKQRNEQLVRDNHLILNAVDQGICGLDIQGRITVLNPAALRISGRAMDQLIGQPIDSLLQHPDGRPIEAIGPDASVITMAEGLCARNEDARKVGCDL